MKKLCWVTDLHLDLATEEAKRKLVLGIQEQKANWIVVTGDVSEKGTSFQVLTDLQKEVGIPLYYVLGNHDYFGSSYEYIRSLAAKYPNIGYLTTGMIVDLDAKTCLVGQDGWPDGGAGDFESSRVLLKDFLVISDFMGYGKHQWRRIMEEFSRQSTLEGEATLLKAFETYDKVIFATHVPPFRECCYWQGEPSRDDWAPFFVNQTLGKMFIEMMENYPDKELLILCGHTHAAMEYHPLPNLTARVGHADYGTPKSNPQLYFNA